MSDIIIKAIKNPNTNVVISMTPIETDVFLSENGWELRGKTTTGYRCDNWDCIDYVCKYYPSVRLTMMWNGWTGEVKLVATHIEEDE